MAIGLIPSGLLGNDDTRGPAVAEAVSGLMRLYEVEGTFGRLGVVARPRQGKIGDESSREQMLIARTSWAPRS